MGEYCLGTFGISILTQRALAIKQVEFLCSILTVVHSAFTVPLVMKSLVVLS
jgi:hypothetical protein